MKVTEKNGKRARTIRAAICMRKVITLMRAVRYYFVIIMYFHYAVHVGTRFYLASQSSHGRVDRQDYLAQHLDPERTSSDYVNAAAYGNLPSRLALRSTTTRCRGSFRRKKIRRKNFVEKKSSKNNSSKKKFVEKKHSSKNKNSSKKIRRKN